MLFLCISQFLFVWKWPITPPGESSYHCDDDVLVLCKLSPAKHRWNHWEERFRKFTDLSKKIYRLIFLRSSVDLYHCDDGVPSSQNETTRCNKKPGSRPSSPASCEVVNEWSRKGQMAYLKGGRGREGPSHIFFIVSVVPSPPQIYASGVCIALP